MGSLVALLMLLSLTMLWVFLRFPPPTHLPKVLTLVNRLFLGLAAVLGLSWAIRAYIVYEGDDLMPVWAAFGAFALVLAVLVFGFILRNFVIFRTRDPF